VHGDVTLRGPVWLFATTVILIALLLAVFVIADAIRRARRAGADDGSPVRLWPYAVAQALFLMSLVVAQVLEGTSLVSALPVVLAPVALGFGVAYLLRVVFPRPHVDGGEGEPLEGGDRAPDGPSDGPPEP